jgi:hypothetical protein
LANQIRFLPFELTVAFRLMVLGLWNLGIRNKVLGSDDLIQGVWFQTIKPSVQVKVTAL